MNRRMFVIAIVVAALAATRRRAAKSTASTPSRRSRRSSPATARYDIGVRTMQVTDKNRPDILNTKEGGPTARYDRTLTLEVWYPATLAAGQKPGGEYRAITRDPAITATLLRQGRPRRRAADDGRARFPLVIISHGYPGNRFLMSHLGENLASKGFVAVSIDHKDSTYDDQKAFASTLYNRPFDQLFVLNEIARLGKPRLRQFPERPRRRQPHRHRRLLDGRLRRRQRRRRRLQRRERDADRRAAEQAAGGARRRESRISRRPSTRGSRPPSPSRRGACRRGFWDAEGLKGIHDAAAVRRRQRRRCGRLREGNAGDLSGRGQRRSLSADVHQRQPQRRRADSGAGRNLRVLGDA